MKRRTVALAASLLLNAVALWLIDREQPAASAIHTTTGNARAAQTIERTTGSSFQLVTPSEEKDYAVYREQLLAAGVPVEMVRAAIRASLEEPRLARQREFYAAAAKQPWWQGGLVTQDITPAQQRELRELQAAERAEVRRILGPAAYVTDGERERFAFLPPDKAERLAMLDRDYDEMVRRPPGGAPDSAERQQLLKKEYERDRAALLTSEEMALLAERESSAARSFGLRLEFFPATEAEYRALLQQQKVYDDRFNGSGSGTLEERQLRAEEMRKVNASIRETLGPERYARFLLSQRSEYGALVELQKRFAVPQNTFEEVARVQGEAMAEGNRIFDNAALDSEQKRAALKEVASKARNGVRSALGDDLGQTFLAATGGFWVDLLDRGTAYSMGPGGGASSRTLAPAPPPTPSDASATAR